MTENYELEPDYQSMLERIYYGQRCGLALNTERVRRVRCPGCDMVFYTQRHNRKYCRYEPCAKLYRAKLRKERRSDIICACCGKAFDAGRSDAKYCSNACRQKAYRNSVTDVVGCNLGNLPHP